VHAPPLHGLQMRRAGGMRGVRDGGGGQVAKGGELM
jgi:hypothetical protein